MPRRYSPTGMSIGLSQAGDRPKEDYIELFLKWKGSGESPQIKAWLQKNGLSVLPMKHGLLITGGRQQIEKVFSVSLENKQPPFGLPLPGELQPFVEFDHFTKTAFLLFLTLGGSLMNGTRPTPGNNF